MMLEVRQQQCVSAHRIMTVLFVAQLQVCALATCYNFNNWWGFHIRQGWHWPVTTTGEAETCRHASQNCPQLQLLIPS